MKSLVRQKFIDETWDATDLDAAARFWLRLYELTAANQKYSLPPKHALELRLWGFPRADAESLLSKLESLVKDSGSGSASLTLENPDKILLTTGVVSVANPPLAGLGLPWVNSSEFNGLVVEIRLRVRGHNRRRPRPLDVALVLTGVLFDGKLIAKAVWRCHRGWPEDETYRYARIQGEEAWLTALGEFKRAETVTEDRSGWLTPLSSRDEDGLTVWKMLNTRFGRPRLLGVTHRALILIAAVTCLVALVAWLVQQQFRPFGAITAFVGICGGCAFVGYLCWQFVWNELALLRTFTSYRAHYGKELEKAARYAILTPDESAILGNDPAVRKHTADLIAEQFSLLGDVAEIPTVEAECVYRTFGAPDGITYLTLLAIRSTGGQAEARVHAWPYLIQFQPQTFFHGGGRVDSIGGEGCGYRRHAVGPGILFRSAPAVSDPIEFYKQHGAAAEAFALENGLTPIRHERLEEFIRRQETISDEECTYFRDHPYSWWDHMRWYLQWPRTEQRG